jgi:ubiquinone/menaquinone biosynthesis C-methylase UbiE
MDESKEQVVGLFSRAAPTYDSVGPRHFSYFASRLVEFADVHPGSDVLDVATGTGVVLVAVSQRLGGSGSVVGIDLAEAMLKRAAAEIELRSVPSVELRVMDAEALQFPDSSFDFVLCSFAFLALPHKERALEEFRRVLKPGGRVGLLDAFGWFFQHDSRWLWQERLLRAYGVLDVERGGAEWTDADLEHALRCELVEQVLMRHPGVGHSWISLEA